MRDDPYEEAFESCEGWRELVRLFSRRQTNSRDRKTGALVFVLVFPSVCLLPGAPAGSFSAMAFGTLKLQLAQVSP